MSRSGDLAQRAVELTDEIESCLIDEHGLVRSAMHMSTRGPFPDNYFDGGNLHLYPGRSWTDFRDYMAYENVGMCSGAYLTAMVSRYDASGAPDALAIASRTFDGIRWLFELSQQVEDGFFCKCYGARISHQISSDQYIYTLIGLDRYLPHATPKQRDQGIDMIDRMVRFWMRRDYRYPYFGKPLDWPLCRFPGFAWLAWVHTGDPIFRHEYERLVEHPDVIGWLPYGTHTWEQLLEDARTRDPAFPFEEASSQRLLRLNPEQSESGLLSLWPMIAWDAPHQDLWRAKLRAMYERDRRWIAADGYAKGAAIYDLETGQIEEVRHVMHIPDHDSWRYLGYVGWIRSGMHAAMFARAAVAIASLFPEYKADAIARDILTKLTRDRLLWFVDMDGQQYPPELKWMADVYSGDAATHWLWTWWDLQRLAPST